MYYAYFYYVCQTQKVTSIGFPIPLIGHLVQLVRSFNSENKLPFVKLIENIGGVKFNRATVVFACNEPYLVINDVKIVE